MRRTKKRKKLDSVGEVICKLVRVFGELFKTTLATGRRLSPAQSRKPKMLSKHCIVRISLCLILLGLVAAVPAVAGSAVIGSVAASMNATVGGQTLFPNTTLFSDDRLQVGEGLAVLTLGSASRTVFGHDTVASFLRDSNEVTVLVGQGNVYVVQDVKGIAVRVKVGDVSVVPVSGFTTLGKVAALNGTIVVTAKEEMLRVEGNGPAVNVTKGKTITVVPRMKAPQGGGGGTSGATLWGVTATGAAAAVAILAGVAMSRASNANTNASAAASEAAAASSAANAAAAAAANAVGCALDTLANDEGYASPYTPPAGETCP
jgi:hypothetical protein